MIEVQNATDSEILAEVARVQYLFGLKKVVRYGLSREEELETESVAEHIYGMHILAEYFLPREDPKNEWDHARIHKLILWHEIDELETGDIMGHMKNDADRKHAEIAVESALAKMPASLHTQANECLNEYVRKKTPEARFTKAIDKIEPSFHILNENGKKIQRHAKMKFTEHVRIKDTYFVGFPVIQRFNEVINIELKRRHFFVDT